MIIIKMIFALCLCTYLFGASVGELHITYNGTDLRNLQNNGTIKIIEGQKLLLFCTHDTKNETFKWSRNSKAFTRSDKVELEKIRIEDEGLYICTLTFLNSLSNEVITEEKQVHVKVLYPPTYPTVEGPASALVGEQLSLTCIVDAEPQPSYKWTRDTTHGPLLSRSKTYNFTVPSSSFKIYCIIQNKMIPTFGEPKSAPISRTIKINVHSEAAISSMTPYPYVDKNEGDSVVIYCYITGKPTPKVWWSKTGDDTFYWPGGRFASYNIDTSISGNYVCNVENTVVTANGVSKIIHKTKVTHVRVFGKKLNTPKPEMNCYICSTVCAGNSTLQMPTTTYVNASSVVPATYSESTPSRNCSEDEHVRESEKDNDTILIWLYVATITGWFMFLVMLLFNVYLFKYKNTTSTKSETSTSHSARRMENQSCGLDNSSAESSYVITVRIPEHQYEDLTTYDEIA